MNVVLSLLLACALIIAILTGGALCFVIWQHLMLLRQSKQSKLRAEEAIQTASAKTELILSSITSILIGVSHDGLVTHWNQVAENTFGLTAADVIKRPFLGCGIRWTVDSVIHGIQSARKKNIQVRVDDVPFTRLNGQAGFLGMTIIPIRSSEEGKVDCVIFGADITERKRLESLKDEFVSTVSHELRTPLTIIREGVSQVYEGILGAVNDDQRRFLAMSLEGIDRLGRVVDDLLDISKIEASKMRLKKEIVDMTQLVRDISAGFEFRARQRGVEIRINVPNHKVEIMADRDKMTQIFTNLIHNALKFTAKGWVEVSIAERNGFVECGVSDTGSGISPEDLPKVFGKFQQFGREVGPGGKGTGLGLAICKGIAELHQGTISVQSKVNRGTRFIVTLPKGMKTSVKELGYGQKEDIAC